MPASPAFQAGSYNPTCVACVPRSGLWIRS